MSEEKTIGNIDEIQTGDSLSEEAVAADVTYSDTDSDAMAIDIESLDKDADDKGSSQKKKTHFKFPIKNPLTIIDRYILGKFLGTYFLATLLLLLVIAMFDITEKLDAFLIAPLKETLFDYFASLRPYFCHAR